MIEQVRAASPIQTIISEYGVDLKPKGSTYVGLCPFHPDHCPSLIVNKEHQSFKCWACGTGGDVFTFIMKHECCSFQESLRLLAERSDITTDDAETRASLYRDAEMYARMIRPIPEKVLKYIKSRGITDESIERFGIGYDGGLDGPESIGIKKGLYMPMKGRLVFPIRDFRGRVVAFGGRIGPAEEKKRKESGQRVVKYWNSPETPIFAKRRTLYGAEKKTEWVGVVEGYIDVIACRQRGLNVVAPLGTAVTEEHLSLLRRLGEEVVLIFDGDEAGRVGADNAMNLLLQNEIKTKILMLPNGLDPADVDISTMPMLEPLEYAVSRCESFGLDTIAGAQKASLYIAQIASNVNDSVKIAKAVDLLAKRIGIPKESIMSNVKRSRFAEEMRRMRDFIDEEIAEIAINHPDVDLDVEVVDKDVREILDKRRMLKSKGVRPTITAMSRELSQDACSFAAGLIGKDCRDKIDDVIRAANRRSMTKRIDEAKAAGRDIRQLTKEFLAIGG